MFTRFCFSKTFSYTKKHKRGRERFRNNGAANDFSRYYILSFSDSIRICIVADFRDFHYILHQIVVGLFLPNGGKTTTLHFQTSFQSRICQTKLRFNIKLPSVFQLPTQFGLSILFPLILFFLVMFVPSPV